MIKTLLLITLFVFINGILISAFIKIILEDIKRKVGDNSQKVDNKKYIQLHVLGDNYQTYEAFSQVTHNLEEIRKIAKDKQIEQKEKEELLQNIDKSLMELQTLLFDSQAGAIPNPSILTKSYLQSFTIKALELRVMYETLMGRDITENPKEEKESNILKIVPREEDENKKN